MSHATITKEEIKQDGFPRIPMLIDCLQEFGETLEVPEIRVWCHGGGDDGFHTFGTFRDALKVIKSAKGKKACCEDVPLLAFRGFELNLWEIPQLKTPVRHEDPPPTPFRKGKRNEHRTHKEAASLLDGTKTRRKQEPRKARTSGRRCFAHLGQEHQKIRRDLD